MKKTSVIIIFIIYIGAIVAINFYGLSIKMYAPTIFVNQINCINDEAQLAEDNSYNIVIPYSSNLVYQLLYKVEPINADNKDVEFIYDEENVVARVDRFGKVIFNASGVLVVYIKSTDGSDIVRKIKIIAY